MKRVPLPKGAVIEFLNSRGTVEFDNGGPSLSVIDSSGLVTEWFWKLGYNECKIISLASSTSPIVEKEQSIQTEKRKPLPSGTVIEFNGIQAIVAPGDTGDNTLEVITKTRGKQVWPWKIGRYICTVVDTKNKP